MHSDLPTGATVLRPHARGTRRTLRRGARLGLLLTTLALGVLALLATAGPTVLAGQPAVSLGISGLGAAQAGTTQTIRVTASVAGKPSASYRGTVVFTSTDPNAVLPAPYRFTPRDRGAHTFTVTLKAAGMQTVTVQDAAGTAATGSAVSTVAPAAAASITLDGLDDGVAGTAQTASVTAHDAYGNVATGYRGTVAFVSGDPQAELPAPYAFTGADAGSRSFSITLKTAGAQGVTVADVADASLTAAATVAIASGAAADLALTTNLPRLFLGFFEYPTATAGVPFSVTIRAVDAYGNTATGYAGDVELSSSDVATPLPNGASGSGVLTFGPEHAGTRTLNDLAFFEKRTYEGLGTFGAVDANDDDLAASMLLPVLPGPAVRYECGAPTSQASFYQEANGPIGVNDGLGMRVTAFDAYGNDATNRPPRQALGARLPPGYQADATVVTSDPQAAFGEQGAVARITADEFASHAPSLYIRFRTAGEQTLTITDPNNAALSTTCTYRVEGPRAVTGTMSIADPFTTGNESTWLIASSYLPPNGAGYTITNLSPPMVTVAGELRPLGTVEAVAFAGRPYIYWDLNPETAPPGTVTCTTATACVTNGPRGMTYRLTDEWGNQSDGSIVLSPWTAPVEAGNVAYRFLEQPDPNKPAEKGVVIGTTTIPLNIDLTGVVLNVTQTTTTVQVGTLGAMTMASPTDGNLTEGSPVIVTVREPLVVAGNVPTCDPEIETCHKSSFAEVTVIDPNADGSPDAPVYVLHSMLTETCGFWDPAAGTCPTITVDVYKPPPFSAVKDQPFTYQFFAYSSPNIDDPVTFSLHSGTLPPGLTLSSDGFLSGVPTTLGSYNYDVRISGTDASAIFYFITQVSPFPLSP